MANKNMIFGVNKEISTVTGTIVIVAATVIIFGGVFIYQFSASRQVLSLLIQTSALASLLHK